ncbi:MAG TPA: DNA internalization-related competence protein ComEC/Rec2 [Thermoanaerobaculia bacterium]|jgi:competence protein ComEC|nr:DNA internalization-related competence protein ComEC/Rec2 [Thermoanaerobaculia bacterium]
MKTNDRNTPPAPLFAPALALAAGALFALFSVRLSVPLLVALIALGLALRRRFGVLVAAVGAGALVATLFYSLPGRAELGVDSERPVVLSGRIAGHWTADEDGWEAPFEVDRFAQAGRSVPARFAARLRIPGEEEPPEFGSAVRAEGYLKRSAPFANAGPSGSPGPGWRMSLKSRVFLEVERPPGALARLSARWRRALERQIGAAGPESAGKALVRAFVLGDASSIDPAWKRGLRWTGLFHLLSVSGVHVGLAAALVFLLGGLLGGRLPRGVRLLLAAGAVTAYLMIAGPLPALVRASVMGFLAVAALAFERPPAAKNGLGLALLLAVASRPDLVLDLSFQLSMSATVGLLVIAPRFEQAWNRRPLSASPWLLRALAASAGAEVATLAWALPAFHLLTPASFALNLIAIPWAALALAGCFVWLGLACLAPEFAARTLPWLDALAAPLGWPARIPGSWRPTIPVAAGLATAALLAVGLGLLALVPDHRLSRSHRVVLALAGTLALGGFAIGAHRPHGTEPTLAMIDVGQGDSILLRDRGRAILIDGGGWRHGDLGGRVLLPALLAEGIRRLDAVVMTHPDTDHCQGLVDLSSYLDVGEIWTAPGWPEEGCAGELFAIPGARVRTFVAGARGHVGRWRLEVLGPSREEVARGGSSKENERSLILSAEAFGRRVLLTGDIERVGELHLLDLPQEQLRSDVLKVAHHGSRTSSAGFLLDAVQPRWALISVGPKNPYYHPSPEVLARFADRNLHVLRTDRDGEIRLRFGADGRIRLDLPGAPKEGF